MPRESEILHTSKYLAIQLWFTLKGAQVLIKQWRKHYIEVRTHSALGYIPLAPKAIVPEDNNRENIGHFVIKKVELVFFGWSGQYWLVCSILHKNLNYKVMNKNRWHPYIQTKKYRGGR